MGFSDILLLALKSLRQSKLRASLTVAGVVVGVTAIVSMVSFALGLQENLLNRSLAKFDIFTTIPVSGATMSMLLDMSQGGAPDPSAQAAQMTSTATTPPERTLKDRLRSQPARRQLDDKAISEIEAIPGVVSVAPRLSFTAFVQYEGRTRQLSLSGAPVDLSRLGRSTKLLAGREFSNDYAREIIVSEYFMQAGDPERPGRHPPTVPTPRDGPRPTEAQRRAEATRLLGTQFIILTLRSGEPSAVPEERFNRDAFTIVGVVGEETGQGVFERLFSGSSGNLLPVGQAKLLRLLNRDPLSRIGQAFVGDTGYPGALVRVRDASQTQEVFEAINRLGLRAISLSGQLSEMKTAFLAINAGLALLGGLSLFVAGLGISNTLIMSITERTREIGVMKAIGGDDRTIMSLFLCEAALLGLLGGVLGVLSGWGVDRIANAIVNRFIAGRNPSAEFVEFFSIPWYLWSGAIAFAVGVSLLAAIYPAFRAARIDPIRALRHD